MSFTRKSAEDPTKSGIIVTQEINPTGSRAYRVDIPASITGKHREQRQFPTKEETRKYAAKRYAEITLFGHAAFALTAQQRTDTTRAIVMLSPFGLTLEDAAKLAVSHIPRHARQITISSRWDTFLTALGLRNGKLTQRRPQTLLGLRWRLANFEKRFGSLDVPTISANQVKVWLSSLGPMSSVSLSLLPRRVTAMLCPTWQRQQPP